MSKCINCDEKVSFWSFPGIYCHDCYLKNELHLLKIRDELNKSCDCCENQTRIPMPITKVFHEKNVRKGYTENQDTINQPPHYTKWGIEPINFIEANGMSFTEWAIIKYITRYKYKNWLEDLLKAEFFLKRLIQHNNRDNDGNPKKTNRS